MKAATYQVSNTGIISYPCHLRTSVGRAQRGKLHVLKIMNSSFTTSSSKITFKVICSKFNLSSEKSCNKANT